MSERTSLVGGLLSFASVILLSWLSLDMMEGGGFFMREVVGSEVFVLTTGEGATDDTTEDTAVGTAVGAPDAAAEDATEDTTEVSRSQESGG